jgi:hypothetical protein
MPWLLVVGGQVQAASYASGLRGDAASLIPDAWNIHKYCLKFLMMGIEVSGIC